MNFLRSLPPWLYVLVISIVPFVELRGAIPVGAAMNMPFSLNFAIAIIGNMLPVPLILLFIPRILDFLEKFKLFRPVVLWLRQTAEKNSKKVLKSEIQNSEPSTPELSEATPPSKKRAELMTPAIFVGLMLFVALPIPGTGAWSGSLVASLFSLSRKYSLFAIFLGVIICALIMSLASYGVLDFLSFLI